jgi:hypothetical protein
MSRLSTGLSLIVIGLSAVVTTKSVNGFDELRRKAQFDVAKFVHRHGKVVGVRHENQIFTDFGHGEGFLGGTLLHLLDSVSREMEGFEFAELDLGLFTHLKPFRSSVMFGKRAMMMLDGLSTIRMYLVHVLLAGPHIFRTKKRRK